ncbi:hypothetical protein KQI82_01040 [Oscillibacter sp. MSJ-2]|uniref:LIM zinc-binding domain-containing protein n=1 Tax=Dysosmobacter acutus TaxID=2841504 RepID=A0ABS6F657_9FIRM|nr:hypothetical protein [Dysosmobacter acutus]MBU5625520.1 hypothetical protein [Dysosmobacter acutus]
MRYPRYALRCGGPVCSRCGREIGGGEQYWYINGGKICEECLPGFAREVFSPFRLIRGGEKRL